MQLMASDKATQYPANGFSFRGLTSYLANNNNTQTNNDFSSPVAESSAADRPRAPAALGERESVNGYLQRLCLQRSQLLRSVRSGGVPARKGQAACRLVVVAQSPFASRAVFSTHLAAGAAAGEERGSSTESSGGVMVDPLG